MRLVIVSEQGMDPWINLSTFAPALEEGLLAFPNVTVVRPPLVRRANVRSGVPAWLSAIRTVRGADAVFWLQGSARPHGALWALAYAKPTARRSALTVDAWRPNLERISQLARVQRLDALFVPFLEAYEELAARWPRGPWQWMPFGIDTDVFRDHGEPRSLFAYWMGRRNEQLHEALVAYTEAEGLDYHFTRRGGEVEDPMELGRLVNRSEFFLCTPPDDLAKTGGYRPLVMRYLEGLAGGARLLGTLPDEREFDRLLPRDAIVEVALDGSDLRERLEVARADAGAAARTSALQGYVRAEHSWARRAEAIHRHLSGAGERDAPAGRQQWSPPAS